MYILLSPAVYSFFFFFNDTATTEIYTLSLHDALPICGWDGPAALRAVRLRCYRFVQRAGVVARRPDGRLPPRRDRKSTRLNSSHGYISYAVFCLKKKKKVSKSDRLTNDTEPAGCKVLT